MPAVITERDMEDQIAANPEKFLGEPELMLVARQFAIGEYRFDLLFEDRHKAKLIVEVQRGTLDRDHSYRILDYYHRFREQRPDEFIDAMVVANQIPAERRKRLHDLGVACREIPLSEFTAPESPVSKLPAPPSSDISVPAPMQSTNKLFALDGGVDRSYQFKSLGPSAFVSAVRNAIARTTEAARWRMGGDSSLSATFLPAKAAIDRRELDFDVTPQLWMERPKGGKAVCKFEVASRGTSPIDEGSKTRREELAASLRAHLNQRRLPDGVEPSMGSTVVKYRINVDAIKKPNDDVPATVAQYGFQIAEVVEFFRFLDQSLSTWSPT